MDIELDTDLTKAGRSDNLSDTIDYVSIFKLVRFHVEGKPRALIESVAYNILEHIFVVHNTVHTASVRICKPQVSIPGVLEHAAVELSRDREGFLRDREGLHRDR